MFKLGQQLDISNLNKSTQKSVIVTSRDFDMTSCPICMIKLLMSANVLPPFIWKRTSKQKRRDVNHYQGTFNWKLITSTDFDGFWWRHQFITSLMPQLVFFLGLSKTLDHTHGSHHKFHCNSTIFLAFNARDHVAPCWI